MHDEYLLQEQDGALEVDRLGRRILVTGTIEERRDASPISGPHENFPGLDVVSEGHGV